eukprot:TRINITY_DN66575_c0_g1_i1.p1 TRINITY_DN66575_c0_g1~~TRINITY_DN66575_c0_g1_i1.p1  ORF type:complete len:382 (-),score=65.05 TRINITY_DN66575_c0_g1_i1:85-1209(-)
MRRLAFRRCCCFSLGIAVWAVCRRVGSPSRPTCQGAGAGFAWASGASGRALLRALQPQGSTGRCSVALQRLAGEVSDGAPSLAGSPGEEACMDDDDDFEELYGEWLESMEEARSTIFGDAEDPEDLEAALAEVLEDDQPYEGLLDNWESIQINDTWALSVARASREVDKYMRLKWDEESLDKFVHDSGIVMWSGALGMARWMASDPKCLAIQGKHVMELGAGLGMPGVVAARLGAARVWLQDRLEAPLRKALATAAKNGVLEHVTSLESTWEDLPQKTSSTTLDVFLGCDILYNAETYKALADVLDKLLLKSAQVAYIMDPPYRLYRADFAERCRGHGLQATESKVTVWTPSPEEQDEEYRLMVIRRQPSLGHT